MYVFQDPEILCWDLRQPGHLLFTTKRLVTTNQRIYFDTDFSSHFLVSGNQDGSVCVWDTEDIPTTEDPEQEPLLNPVLTFSAHKDTVNGVR